MFGLWQVLPHQALSRELSTRRCFLLPPTSPPHGGPWNRKVVLGCGVELNLLYPPNGPGVDFKLARDLGKARPLAQGPCPGPFLSPHPQPHCPRTHGTTCPSSIHMPRSSHSHIQPPSCPGVGTPVASPPQKDHPEELVCAGPGSREF